MEGAVEDVGGDAVLLVLQISPPQPVQGGRASRHRHREQPAGVVKARHDAQGLVDLPLGQMRLGQNTAQAGVFLEISRG